MPYPRMTAPLTGLALIVLCAVQTLSAATQSTRAKPGISVNAEARALDTLIETIRTKDEIPANGEIDDLTFARRAYLDLGGRLPTPDEVDRYLKGASDSPSRRQALIDDLVGSPAWHSHRYNQVADMLRLDVQLAGQVPGHPYITWLKNAIKENMPYDQFARELIASRGGLWDPNNGKVGFYLRNRGMPEDHSALTVQFFLGQRIQCAQCHDHPDDYFTRRQFMNVSAFEHIATTREAILKADNRQMRDRTEKDRDLLSGSVNKLKQAIAPGVGEYKGRDAIKVLPEDWQYSGAPGEVVQPSPLWGRLPHPPRGSKEVGQRGSFANWVTSEQPAVFAAVLGNRLWADLFGRGLVEPVDDWRPDNPATNKKLGQALTQLVEDCEYDVELIVRILARTDAYQRAASVTLAADIPAIAGPVSRRLSAEQVWDSIMALTVPQVDERPGKHFVSMAPLYKRIKNAGVNEVLKVARECQDARDEYRASQMHRKIESQLSKARSEYLRVENAGDDRKTAEAYKKYEEAYAAASEVMMMAYDYDRMPHIDNGIGEWQRFNSAWVRASELRQPADPTHFVRIFGASDRNLTDGARRDGGLLQSLSLMNYAVDSLLLSGNSAFSNKLRDLGDDPVAELYLALLQREPSQAERDAIAATMPQSGRTSMPDLVWALVNSTEFIHHR